MVTLRWGLVFTLFGFGCVIAGAFMPWIEVGAFSEAGIKGRGLVPLILACIGAILVLCGAHGERLLAALCAVCILALVVWARQIAHSNVDAINSMSLFQHIDRDEVIGVGPTVAGFDAIVAGL